MSSKPTFKKYQGECLIAAHDLCYPESVFIAIRAAKTEAELSNIMMSALKGKYNAKKTT